VNSKQCLYLLDEIEVLNLICSANVIPPFRSVNKFLLSISLDSVWKVAVLFCYFDKTTATTLWSVRRFFSFKISQERL